jgi:hypothetical protein
MALGGSCIVGMLVLLLRAALFDRSDTAFTGNGDRLPYLLHAHGEKAGVFLGACVFVLVVTGILTLSRVFSRWPEFADLPNGHYWLAPERRSRTVSEVRGWLYLFGAVVHLWIIAVTFILDGRYRPGGVYNGPGDMSMEPFPILAGCALFMVPALLLMALYVRRYSRIEETRR